MGREPTGAGRDAVSATVSGTGSEEAAGTDGVSQVSGGVVGRQDTKAIATATNGNRERQQRRTLKDIGCSNIICQNYAYKDSIFFRFTLYTEYQLFFRKFATAVCTRWGDHTAH